jgi:excisionase family DNA binding protein
MTIDLGKLIADPKLVEKLEPAQANKLLAQLTLVQACLASRALAVVERDTNSENLLTVEQAAERLKCSKDWLYRRSRTLPFVRRVGGLLRFSSDDLDKYIRNRPH